MKTQKEQNYNPNNCDCKMMIGGSGKLCPNCIAFNQGKAQAISEFKEKLKEELFNEFQSPYAFGIIERVIEKTAQEMK